MDVRDPILRLGQKDETIQRNDVELRKDYVDWYSSKQNQGRRENRFNTILEEEDSSDGF